MEVCTAEGLRLTLKEPAFKSGGEGSIYEIVGHPNSVAKIYRTRTDAAARRGKICEMARVSRLPDYKSSVLNNTAWPCAALFSNGNFVGFGMRKVNTSRELDDIYSQINKASSVGIPERIKILVSLCDVVDQLHARGQIVGDFNPSNIKVDDQYNVYLLDADSFHFSSGKSVYPCSVCAPGYAAPEIVRACRGDKYLDAYVRGTSTFTKTSDYFALAVHIFRMLMNGCHPYTCRNEITSGSPPAPLPQDVRIERGQTPFFVSVPGFTTPAWAPSINCLPEYIRRLFERAFVEGNTNPSVRPGPKEWKAALLQYQTELVRCSADSKHYFWNRLNKCPYCVASRATGQTVTPHTDNSKQTNSITHLPEREKRDRRHNGILPAIISVIIQALAFRFLYGPMYSAYIEPSWLITAGPYIGALLGICFVYLSDRAYNCKTLFGYVMQQLFGVWMAFSPYWLVISINASFGGDMFLAVAMVILVFIDIILQIHVMKLAI